MGSSPHYGNGLKVGKIQTENFKPTNGLKSTRTLSGPPEQFEPKLESRQIFIVSNDPGVGLKD